MNIKENSEILKRYAKSLLNELYHYDDKNSANNSNETDNDFKYTKDPNYTKFYKLFGSISSLDNVDNKKDIIMAAIVLLDHSLIRQEQNQEVKRIQDMLKDLYKKL